MVNDKFNELDWHDAQILSIHLDRSNPGHSDEVQLIVVWPDKTRSKLIFYRCYQMNATLNFNVIARETVRHAHFIATSKSIDKIRKMWGNLGADPTNLKQYEIQTNSTGSDIIIWALGFRMEDTE
jgi:hypothetical protein